MIKGMFPPYKYGIRKGMGAGGVSGASIPRSGLQFYADLWHPEQQGFCLSFDGNDYLSNATANFRSADSQGAIEGWARYTGATGMTLFSSSNTTTDNTHYVNAQIRNAGDFSIDTREGASQNAMGTVATFADGKWHHFVVSSSGTAYTLIVDGVTQSLTVLAGSNNGNWFADITTRNNLSVGAWVRSGGSIVGYSGGEQGFTRIYSRPMLQPEVQLNYQRGRKASASDTTGLVFNLPCTEGTGNPIDTVGSLTMTITGATWVEGLMDRSPNALPMTSFGSPAWSSQGRSFVTANNTHIDVGNIPAIVLSATDLTINFWFKSSTAQTGHSIMFYDADDALGPTADWYILLKTTLTVGGFSNTSEYNTGIVVVDGAWHLLTFVKEQTLLTLYKDGTSVWTQAVTQTHANFSTAFSLKIADNANVAFGTFQNGEDSIYNRALSAPEISQIYNSTKWRYV